MKIMIMKHGALQGPKPDFAPTQDGLDCQVLHDTLNKAKKYLDELTVDCLRICTASSAAPITPELLAMTVDGLMEGMRSHPTAKAEGALKAALTVMKRWRNLFETDI